MDIKAKFLELTSKTYPLGTEKETYKFLSEDFIKDPYDNLYWIIGDSNTLFCAHLDTIGQSSVDVVHVEEGNMIKTNGKTILGADDKAGVVIMLEMIEKQVPGFYLFTIGEEKACVGSSKLSYKLDKKMDPKFKNIQKIIAFDRAGYNSVITHQMQQKSCSDEFADALIDELNKLGFKYQKDPHGWYCDSAEFADLFPECTNISVGYFDQHSNNERQDIEFLARLSEACCKINWNALPVKRDPKKIEYIDSYYFSKKKPIVDGEEESEFDDYDFHPFEVSDTNDVEIFYFQDKKFNVISDVSYLNREIVDITLSQKRVKYELDLIMDILNEMEIYCDLAEWDGLILTLTHDKHVTKLTRNDLIKYLPELEIESIKKK